MFNVKSSKSVFVLADGCLSTTSTFTTVDWANVPILYPRKMSENLWLCDVFRGYRKGNIRLKRVKFGMKDTRTWSSGLIGRWITNPDKQHRDLLPFEKWSVIGSFWLTIDFLKMTLITERLALNCLSWTWIYCWRIRNYWPQIGKK